MVESRSRKYFFFAVFLLPCVILYSVFFIYPFLNGLYISLTNWDGLTPRSPISMDVTDFETKILSNVKKQSDRDYLLAIYSKDDSASTYNRESLTGSERRKVERILGKAGYAPEKNRFVGLKNYGEILSGKVSESFYPRSYRKSYFNLDAELPSEIMKKDFDRQFLSKLNWDERKLFDAYYADSGESYTISDEKGEFALEDKIWLIPEVNETGEVGSDQVDALVAAIADATASGDAGAKDAAVSAFLSANAVSPASAAEVKAGADGLFALGDLKKLLSSKWEEKGFDLGVIGFTLFFAVFSVIGINLIAFLLALALDTGIKGQKALRSVFFLPNVLSMVIVALIWKMLFFQLFPRLTGIEQWLSDTAKTPWLIVLVAVWQGAGYYMIVYLAGLQNIPTDVVEAAKIDGASPWQRFVNITLPLLIPALTISFFLTIANALKCFDLIYAMTSGSAYALGTVPLVLDIFFDAFARKQAGMATAKAMMLFIVIFAVTGLQLYVMKKKEIEQ